MTATADIFLSYNREDAAMARRFADGFEREGLRVWWDVTLRSGEAYDEVTEKALRDAKAVVVLWSKKSVVSRWVRAEATLADRNRTLVPAMIEPCERPIMFELTQTADLSRWSGEREDPTWNAFVADVRRFVGTGAGPPQTAVRDTPAAASVPAGGASHLRPSLAVLPFTNRSGERADDVFADGMVEDLALALSMSGGLKVIAQSATAVYRKNVSDLRSIGRELGVRYLLEGNVRRAGGSLRVTAQLVEAESGAILWSQRFDRSLTELAELQEQLVLEVAARMDVEIERVEIEKALQKPGDLTAWEALMRARAAFGNFTPEGLRTAVSEARKAVAIAPDYALAHGALGATLANVYMVTGGRDAALAREALTSAQRAFVLAPNDSDTLTWVAATQDKCGRWQEALSHGLRAVELNPNRAHGHGALAEMLIRARRTDEAFLHLDIADSLAPRGVLNVFSGVRRAAAHYVAGRHQQALQAVDEMLLRYPGLVIALKDKAAFCARLERRADALEALRKLRATDPAVTLEVLEGFNRVTFYPPETGAELNEILRSLWSGAT